MTCWQWLACAVLTEHHVESNNHSMIDIELNLMWALERLLGLGERDAQSLTDRLLSQLPKWREYGYAP